ncbi:MAG: FAD-dependent oxidoreductase [Candidatus Azobacteroides sp.]|nr:FAD-dependent oxidoreductase [Candidatus Azobacteroides sp.]
MKILIIGGVAGGAAAAARLRRLDEHAEIILFERGEYISYANCGLPYYIGGTINERDRLFVQTVEGFTGRFKIDVRIRSEVTAVHPDHKTVTVRDTASGKTYDESYDKLVIAVGAEPVRPALPGIAGKRIFTLRSVSDADAIKKFIDDHKPKKAVVAGGGFIGLEMAENLHDAGLSVDVVEMADQVMAPLDFSMAAIVHHHLISKNIGLHLKEKITGFSETEAGLEIQLESKKELFADMVIWSIGVRPEIRLAEEAGLTIGTLGGIAVNEYMQTSDPDIYAAGDAVEVLNPAIGKPALIPLAGPAGKQARIVANNIVEGNKYTYNGTIGTSVVKVFDLTIATAGVSSKVLKKNDVPYLSSYTHVVSHAGYYPGAVPISIKIIFAPGTGRLLGAQVIGFDGVDKRIEMLAQVIQRKGTTGDLTEMEQAYAPPYSSSKDPVNMAGFVADNILSGKMKIIHWREIDRLDPEKDFLLDVRTEQEFRLNHICGAVHIPVDELRSRLNDLPRNKRIIVYCAVGLRGYLACRILSQNGFDEVYNLSGGFKTWSEATGNNELFQKKENRRENMKETAVSNTIFVDACGLACPGPIMQLKKHYDGLKVGEHLEIKATDQAFVKDAEAWCNMTGAKLIGIENQRGVVSVMIEKSEKTEVSGSTGLVGDHKTIIVFSDDLDKALASFVIANGIAATGKKVSMFFTFWGLSVIKKAEKPSVSKDFFGKMFGWMLPSSSKKLGLSKWNMGGLGSFMMRTIMKRKNIESLETLIRQAAEAGVEMIACTMSMDVMGVKKEELRDHVSLGGVAVYLERAESANMNLFI